jgi:hypothetical protein
VGSNSRENADIEGERVGEKSLPQEAAVTEELLGLVNQL